jgi:hypothetical protein
MQPNFSSRSCHGPFGPPKVMKKRLRGRHKIVISTGAHPDFLPRAASNDHACGSPKRETQEPYQRHKTRQEIRASVVERSAVKFPPPQTLRVKQICHLDRSEAQWRDLRFSCPYGKRDRQAAKKPSPGYWPGKVCRKWSGEPAGNRRSAVPGWSVPSFSKVRI